MPPALARTGYRFLICPDAELLRRQATSLGAVLGQGAAKKVFWGDDEPFPPAFWAELTTQSLFSTPTVLLLRRADAMKAETWDRLGEALKSTARTVLPVFCLEGKWKDPGTPAIPHFLPKRALWQAAEKNKWLWKSPGLTDAALPGHIDTWAAQNGLLLEPAARSALIDALPRDAFAAGLELDKIALAAGDGKNITPDMAQLIAPHGDMEFFDFMKALATPVGKNPAALREAWARVLDDHLRPSGDKILFQLLGYVAWQARQLWMLNEGEGAKVRMRPSDKPEMTRMAQRLGRSGIAKIIELTLDTNLAVIGGTRRPDDALEAYVAELSALMRGELPTGAATRGGQPRRP